MSEQKCYNVYIHVFILFVATFVIVYVRSATMITVYLVTGRVPRLTAYLCVHMDFFYKGTSHRLFHSAYIVH